jgi:iron complex outermembrane receptor protein
LGFIETTYSNQDTQEVSGVDFGVNFSVPLGDTVRLNSFMDISHLNSYEVIVAGTGDVLQYAGTLSPCNVTSCSGAPDYRASWQNTLVFGNTSVSLTGYYTSGYDTASIDFGGIEGDCVGNAAIHSSTQTYVDGSPVNCTQDEAWNADLTIRHQFGGKYTVYGDFLNVFDIEPDFDPSAAYSLFGYNPAWQGPNMVGRFFLFATTPRKSACRDQDRSANPANAALRICSAYRSARLLRRKCGDPRTSFASSRRTSGTPSARESAR